MKNYESNDKVFEAYFSHYTAGAFRAGDVITFVTPEKMKKSDAYASIPLDVKEKFDQMIAASTNGDSIIIVHQVNLNPFFTSDFAPSSINIGYSQGGGRITDIITVPGSLAEFFHREENGPNQVSTIPDAAVRNMDERDAIAELDTEKLEAKRNIGHVEDATMA